MSQDIAHQVLRRAYELDGLNLDRLATRYGAQDWQGLTGDLAFDALDTGGGCTMLVAQAGSGPWVGLTDGETSLPTSADTFCLTLEPELFEGEDYALFVIDNQVTARMGDLAGA